MSAFWKKDGKLVKNADGKIIKCDDCPCGPPPPVSCADHDIPGILYVTFGPALGHSDFVYLGTVRVRYDSFYGEWRSALLTSPCPGTSSVKVIAYVTCFAGDLYAGVKIPTGGGTAESILGSLTYVPFYGDSSLFFGTFLSCGTTLYGSLAVTEVAP